MDFENVRKLGLQVFTKPMPNAELVCAFDLERILSGMITVFGENDFNEMSSLWRPEPNDESNRKAFLFNITQYSKKDCVHEPVRITAYTMGVRHKCKHCNEPIVIERWKLENDK